MRFDWADPATQTRALSGVQAVYLVPIETLGPPERSEFVARAKAAEVRRIVQLSVRGIDPGDGGIPETEAAVRASGLEWTVLRPRWFAQDFDAPDFFLSDVRAGTLATPAGDGREPFIDAADIAWCRCVEIGTMATPEQVETG
ncbi:hypothetical protein LRS74_00285 [Streptomyces sp. LX-29]|nr:hypothetical protein LRS74_00285 [Streptomyces sp. LX-29]